MNNEQTCPVCSESQLSELLLCAETSSRFRESSRHVEDCPACQDRLVALAASENQWHQLQQSLATDSVEQMIENEVSERASSWCESSSSTFASDDRMISELLQPPSHPELLGRLGRYDIESVIGSGGMGVVFRGFDSELNRPVAIKVLAPHLSRSGSARARFAREGRAAAAIVHEHVTAIHNVEVEEKPPFLVMQFIAGRSLQARVDEDGPLEVCEILRIAMQTARGLAAAHEQGIIHRDVKPSNVILENGIERALLTDFGLARAADDASMTQSGYHPGTPHYMSPEQARGEVIDHRSDLFSLGCLIYFMCTGHSPFRAENTMGVLHRINHDQPRSLRTINSDIPEWLENIVFRLLEKSPSERFQSTSDVAQTLQQWLSHLQTPDSVTAPSVPTSVMHQPASPESKGGRDGRIPRLMTAIAGFGFLALLGVIVFLETGKGTLRIETAGDVNIPVRILQGDKTVDTLTVTGDGAVTRLRAGRYELQFDENVDGYVIENQSISLQRGGEWIAKVTLKPRDGRDARQIEKDPDGKSETNASNMHGFNRNFAFEDLDAPQALIEFPSSTGVARTVQVRIHGPRGLMVSDAPPKANRATFYSLPHRVDYGYERPVLLAFQDMGQRFFGRLKIIPPTMRSRPYLQHNALPLQITTDDMEHVEAGHIVRKVTFLPKPTSRAVAATDVLTSYRLPSGADVLAEAHELGTPLSVLTLSSKTLHKDLEQLFWFTEDLSEGNEAEHSVRSVISADRTDQTPLLKRDQLLSDMMEPPKDQKILESLQRKSRLKNGELTKLYETQRNNIRIVKERTRETVDPVKNFPMLGPAQMVNAEWRCTVYFDETSRSLWPIPHTISRDGIKETVTLTEHQLILKDGSRVDVPPRSLPENEADQDNSDVESESSMDLQPE